MERPQGIEIAKSRDFFATSVLQQHLTPRLALRITARHRPVPESGSLQLLGDSRVPVQVDAGNRDGVRFDNGLLSQGCRALSGARAGLGRELLAAQGRQLFGVGLGRCIRFSYVLLLLGFVLTHQTAQVLFAGYWWLQIGAASYSVVHLLNCMHHHTSIFTFPKM